MNSIGIQISDILYMNIKNEFNRNSNIYENRRKGEISMTREELNAAHNNIMTVMENRVMQMTGCNRQTANLVANEILDLDRDADKLLNEKEAD